MSGSRTKTGCWTCRLRRKKCDEQHPVCSNCASRDLDCYGYGAKPAWMHDKGNWQQILESEEARAIRNSAEKAYSRRRQKKLSAAPWSSGVIVQGVEDLTATVRNAPLRLDRTWSNCTQPLRECEYTPNFQHVQTFLSVIFPLQWGFFDLHRQSSRGWLFDAIVASEPMYHASRGLCITFEAGVRSGSTSGRCEVTPKVRESRLSALRSLQPYITELQSGLMDKALLPKAIHAVAVILLLASLEVFGEVEGSWETHQQAAGAVLDLIETQIAASFPPEGDIGTIGQLLSNSTPSFETRSLEFFVTTYVWTDILAEALHGAAYPRPTKFDYLPLLRNGVIDTRSIMGCRSSVMISIKQVSMFASCVTNLAHREEDASSLALQIQEQANEAASEMLRLEEGTELDSSRITIIHAYGALIYLQTIIKVPGVVLEETVNTCLELLEALPPRLLIRFCWPFTVAGCIANEKLHSRFLGLVQRAEESGNVIGFTWKGVIVMKSCWQLRRRYPNSTWCCRTTLQHMGSRVLLI